jgi:hypothetical protein
MPRRAARKVCLARIRAALARLTLTVLEGVTDEEFAEELAEAADELLPLHLLPGGVLLERLDGLALRRLAWLLVPEIAAARERLEAVAAKGRP